jgi:hypothetical protein
MSITESAYICTGFVYICVEYTSICVVSVVSISIRTGSGQIYVYFCSYLCLGSAYNRVKFIYLCVSVVQRYI